MNNGVTTNNQPVTTNVTGNTNAQNVQQPIPVTAVTNTGQTNPQPLPTATPPLGATNTVVNQQVPTVQQNIGQQPAPVVQPTTVTEPPKPEGNVPEQPPIKKEKKKMNIMPILIVIILVLSIYTVYSAKKHQAEIENLNYNCTPITSSKEEKKLDLKSTLVQDLYSKVATSIREDLAQPEFNDNMRLYLAYRQILESDKYDSNCNLFDKLAMEPYTCEVSTKFRPKAFKIETLEQEIKKLYGEHSNIALTNIRLGTTSCIGGYEYIPARGEFVQGYCSQQNATSYKVTKTLTEATSTRTTIILKEEVKYHENEKMSLPEYLKSGTYYYTFRLDMNYNYVLVSKTYESKY